MQRSSAAGASHRSNNNRNRNKNTTALGAPIYQKTLSQMNMGAGGGGGSGGNSNATSTTGSPLGAAVDTATGNNTATAFYDDHETTSTDSGVAPASPNTPGEGHSASDDEARRHSTPQQQHRGGPSKAFLRQGIRGDHEHHLHLVHDHHHQHDGSGSSKNRRHHTKYDSTSAAGDDEGETDDATLIPGLSGSSQPTTPTPNLAAPSAAGAGSSTDVGTMTSPTGLGMLPSSATAFPTAAASSPSSLTQRRKTKSGATSANASFNKNAAAAANGGAARSAGDHHSLHSIGKSTGSPTTTRGKLSSSLSELSSLSFNKNEQADKTAKTHRVAGPRKLYAFNDIPTHLQDNQFIRDHYRAYMTTAECLESLFEVHNETGNIWSHLLGVFVYVAMWWWVQTDVIVPRHDGLEVIHRLMFTILPLAMMACLFGSAAFHTMLAHDQVWIFKLSHALDYAGATCLMTGTFIPLCYYAFVCQPMHQIGYITMAVVLGVTGVVAPLLPWFENEDAFFARLGIYVAIGASAAVPSFNLLFTTPLNGTTSLIYSGIAFIFMNAVFAVCIYASNFPERWAPGRFDLWLNSHQIWHTLIFLGCIVQFFNVVALYQNWSIMQGHC